VLKKVRKTAAQILPLVDTSGADGALKFKRGVPGHGENVETQAVGVGIRTDVGKEFHSADSFILHPDRADLLFLQEGAFQAPMKI
jgi:hypothetical protein